MNRMNNESQPKYDWIRNSPIAHRGLHSNPSIPENSLSSFQRAIDCALPIELDLQISRDGKIIVFHDDDLKRICNDDRLVSQVDFDELLTLSLFESNQKIPSLDEVLTFVAGRVPLLIEIKNRNYDGRLEDCIYECLRNYEGEYAIQSFNPFTVDHFRRKDSKILRGMISGTGRDFELPFWKTFVLKNLILLPLVRPHFINYEAEGLHLLAISLIRELTSIPILGWTINSPELMNRYQGQCDNIIFESFDPLKS